MKNLMKIKRNKILAATLALVLLSLVIAPFPLAADECERALGDCFIDAVLAGLLGGLGAFAYYSVACAAGYDWCLKYYQM